MKEDTIIFEVQTCGVPGGDHAWEKTYCTTCNEYFDRSPLVTLL